MSTEKTIELIDAFIADVAEQRDQIAELDDEMLDLVSGGIASEMALR